MLAYAAQGLASEERQPIGQQIREFLQRAVDALSGLADACVTAVKADAPDAAEKYFAFLDVLDRDARDSIRTIELVLAQPTISSQLIDNLNASLHLRAVLTDLFLLRRDRQAADAGSHRHAMKPCIKPCTRACGDTSRIEWASSRCDCSMYSGLDRSLPLCSGNRDLQSLPEIARRSPAKNRENAIMATQAPSETKQDHTAAQKVEQLRALFADAPELGKKALENALREIKSQVSETPPPAIESAGRVGARLGKVSELTIIVPLAPGGAKRLRAFLRLLGGNLNKGDKVGTLHDMRFVFFDNDTRMIFATSFDGDWDAYIDDFVNEDSRLPGHHRLCLGRLARHSQSGREGLPRQAPDHGGRLVRRPSGSDGGGDSPAQAHRQGG